VGWIYTKKFQKIQGVLLAELGQRTCIITHPDIDYRKILPQNAFIKGYANVSLLKKKFSWNAMVFCWIILRYNMYLICLILVANFQPYFSKMFVFKHNRSKKPNLYIGGRFTKIAITQPKIFKFEKFKN